jgi:menaquinone-dependent protoporphyrinogen oxidase
MRDVLILYASKHGHTAKIANRIAQAIREDGVSAHLHDARSADAVSPSGYDVVVVGASIHAGHHQREIVDWVKEHRAALAAKPSAFFSVCLAPPGHPTDTSRDFDYTDWDAVDRFARECAAKIGVSA